MRKQCDPQSGLSPAVLMPLAGLATFFTAKHIEAVPDQNKAVNQRESFLITQRDELTTNLASRHSTTYLLRLSSNA